MHFPAHRKHVTRDTVAFLLRLASFLDSRRFTAFLDDTTTWIETDIGELIAVLNQKLEADLSQCLDMDFVRGYRETAGALPGGIIPLDVAARQFAFQLRRAAETLCCEDFPTQRETKFVVPRASTVLEIVLDAFAYAACMNVTTEIAEHDQQYGVIKHSQLRDGLVRFGAYIEARRTLVHPSGNPRFDRLIAELAGKSDYFRNGYPYDLLVWDRLEMEAGKLSRIVLRKDYCSTFNQQRLRPGESLPAELYRVVAL